MLGKLAATKAATSDNVGPQRDACVGQELRLPLADQGHGRSNIQTPVGVEVSDLSTTAACVDEREQTEPRILCALTQTSRSRRASDKSFAGQQLVRSQTQTWRIRTYHGLVATMHC